jgi:hypothetical protein
MLDSLWRPRLAHIRDLWPSQSASAPSNHWHSSNSFLCRSVRLHRFFLCGAVEPRTARRSRAPEPRIVFGVCRGFAYVPTWSRDQLGIALRHGGEPCFLAPLRNVLEHRRFYFGTKTILFWNTYDFVGRTRAAAFKVVFIWQHIAYRCTVCFAC